jgi:hypothetical protein
MEYIACPVPLFPCAKHGMNLNDVLPSPRVVLHRTGPSQLAEVPEACEMRVAWWDSEMHLEDGASQMRAVPFYWLQGLVSSEF